MQDFAIWSISVDAVRLTLIGSLIICCKLNLIKLLNSPRITI